MMKHRFEFVTSRRNFMIYLTDDEYYSVNTDVVAKGHVNGKDFRLIVPGGTVKLKKLRRNRDRISVLKPCLYALTCSRKSKDILYLQALEQDGANHVWATKLWLFIKGYVIHQWRYNKVRGN